MSTITSIHSIPPNLPVLSTSFFIQLWTVFAAGNDSFGGLSGQDSIWRAVLSIGDLSLGVSLLVALWGIILAHRWESLQVAFFSKLDALHTSEWAAAIPILQVAFRPKWYKPTEKVIRHVTWLEKGEPVTFCQNRAGIPIPYAFDMDPPRHRQCTVTRDSLHLNIAASTSHFVNLLCYGILYGLLRLFIIYHFSKYGWLRFFSMTHVVLRVMLMMSQASSIHTYSCHYKGAETWAIYRRNYPLWTDEEQDKFEAQVFEHLQSSLVSFPSIPFLWLVKTLWKWAGKVSLFSNLAGNHVFCRFSTIPQLYFDHLHESKIKVQDCRPNYPELDPNKIYEITLMMPQVLFVSRHRHLNGTLGVHIIYGFLFVPCAVFSVLEAIQALGNEGLSWTGICILSIMQLASTTLLIFKDIPDQHINTKFSDPIPPVLSPTFVRIRTVILDILASLSPFLTFSTTSTLPAPAFENSNNVERNGYELRQMNNATQSPRTIRDVRIR